VPLASVLLAPVLLAVLPNAPWSPPSGEDRDALVKRFVHEDGEPGFYRCQGGGAYIVKTDVGAGFALDAAAFLERFRSQFRSIFRDVPEERLPPLVVVFRDEARYRRAVQGGASRGMYKRDARTLFTYLDVQKGERDFDSFYAKILLHEGSHQLLATTGDSWPVWLDEGVASYFQEWDVRAPVDANLARLRTTSYRFADVRAAFGTERWVPLARLFALGAGEWAPDDFGPVTKLHYAEAASFISFLFGSRDGERRFAEIYVAIRDGEPATTWLTRGSLRDMEAGWREEITTRIRAEPPPDGAENPK
jgi:hypothetical protein